jgi:hypothetical protein
MAFLERRTWRQAELAHRAGVERKTLVKLLQDLRDAGLPLTRDEDPPQVYWSVPGTWFPGAVAFRSRHAIELVQLLQRTPCCEKRDRVIEQIMNGAMPTGSACRGDAVVTQAMTVGEEGRLSLLQECAEQRTAVRVQRRSASGSIDWHHVSVHRIFVEPRRLVATCHHEGRLSWFCLGHIMSVCPEPEMNFRSVPNSDIARFLDQSVDGYHSGAGAVLCVFRVRTPDAAWVRDRLSGSISLHWEMRDEVTVFRTLTAGLLPLARLIVGLGGVVDVETPELRRLVVELAQSALAVNT